MARSEAGGEKRFEEYVQKLGEAIGLEASVQKRGKSAAHSANGASLKRATNQVVV